MQNSWWTQTDPTPAGDQQAADGMSRFDRAGVDFFTRDGIVRLELRPDAAPATELGLAADETAPIAPIVPVTALVLATDGVFTGEGVEEVTPTTAGDRDREIRARQRVVSG